MNAAVVSIIVGPEQHGVVEHARTLAAATRADVHRSVAVPAGDGLPRPVVTAAVAHLHYTDRLYGPDTATAARCFETLARRLRGRVLVSLHDVPDPDGSGHAGRRVDGYRCVAGRADALIVSSEHERARLHRCGIGQDVWVMPLPIGPVATGPAPAGGSGASHRDGHRILGVLGFIYPGKGHAEVLDASTSADQPLDVWAIGRASDGHADLVASLRCRAAAQRTALTVTGFVADPVLGALLRRVDVPVVAARQPSASASLARWIAAGRRPLVAASAYACELAGGAPDLLTLYDAAQPGGLDRAVRIALDDPASTWHGGTVPERLTVGGVAQDHRRLYARLGASS